MESQVLSLSGCGSKGVFIMVQTWLKHGFLSVCVCVCLACSLKFSF